MNLSKGNLMDAAPGDLLAVRARGFVPFAWLIRMRTVAVVNHVACCVGGGLITEALPSGITTTSITNYRNDWWILLRPPAVAPAAQVWMTDFLAAQLGKKYDWRGVLGFDFLLGKNRENPEKWFCSELARGWYEAGGLKPLARLPRGLTSPQSLIQWDDLETVAYNWPDSLKDYL